MSKGSFMRFIKIFLLLIVVHFSSFSQQLYWAKQKNLGKEDYSLKTFTDANNNIYWLISSIDFEFETKINSQEDHLQIDASNFSKGLYLCKWVSENKCGAVKFVKY